jgi:hypothetical protein
VAEVGDGVGWLRWAKVTGAVRPSTVAVPNVFHEHSTQVPLVDDQHTVGGFGSEGSDEPLGEAVRLRTPRWNPDHLDAHIGEDSVE